MLDGFRLRRFDRGLSIVDADDPDTRDGVRVLPTTSNLGKRDDEIVGVLLPWRALDATDVDTGTLCVGIPLLG